MAPAMSEVEFPHIAFLPCAGLGHLLPFLRLAESLASRGCAVTFVCPTPFVSAAEADIIDSFVSSSPLFRLFEFPLPLSQVSDSDRDPFFLQFERISGAAHLLGPILSAVSPPLSAIVMDVFFTSLFVPIARSISLPIYIKSISNAAMLSFLPSFRRLRRQKHPQNPRYYREPSHERLPAATTRPETSLHCSVLRQREGHDGSKRDHNQHLGCLRAGDSGGAQRRRGRARSPASLCRGSPPTLRQLCGNSLHCVARRAAGFLRHLRVFREPHGPAAGADKGALCGTGEQRVPIPLGPQDEESRQRRGERRRANGERTSGRGIPGERVEGRGKVVKGWVDQQAVLEHPAVGGFMNHSGWNSLTEAAQRGVRVLLWPRGGDQRISAMVVEKNGLGEWPSEWSWDGDEQIVSREEIGRRLRAFMNETPAAAAAAAARVKEQAIDAVADGGSSQRSLDKLVAIFHRGNRQGAQI